MTKNERKEAKTMLIRLWIYGDDQDRQEFVPMAAKEYGYELENIIKMAERQKLS